MKRNWCCWTGWFNEIIRKQDNFYPISCDLLFLFMKRLPFSYPGCISLCEMRNICFLHELFPLQRTKFQHTAAWLNCNLIHPFYQYFSIGFALFLDRFSIVFGLVLVTIFRSFISYINAIYLLRYMAFISLINECYMTDISE